MQAQAGAAPAAGQPGPSAAEEFGFEMMNPVAKPKTSFEKISAACEKVVNLQRKLAEDAAKWLNKGEISKDCALLRDEISHLDLKGLDDQNKTRLIPTLCKAYRALENVVTNSAADEQLKADIRSRQGFIKLQCYGLGDELCQLSSVVDMGLALANASNPERYLLNVKDRVDLDVIEEAKTTNAQQLEVAKVLQNIVAHLKKPEVVRHFTVLQVLQMKFAVDTLVANYLFHQRKALSQSEHIFQDLLEANKCLNKILASRDVAQFAGVKDDSALGRLMLLKTTIALSPQYPREFWDNPRHIEELSQYVEIMPSCRQFISDPKSHDVKGLVFLGKDDESGLALFKWPHAKEDDPKALVVFSYNHEGQGSYWNFLQNREAMLGLGGLAHAPVLQPVYKCKKALDGLISKSTYANQPLPLITAGFGIDGALAQVLAYLWAVEHPAIQTKTFAMGTAPFLDVDAAPTFQKCPNHYAMNFRLFQDRMMEQSATGAYVQKQYSDANFHAIYPLYNRDWFASDILSRGHDVGIYLGNMQKGMKQPRDLHALYTELKEILNIVGLTSEEELPKALQNYFQKFNNG